MKLKRINIKKQTKPKYQCSKKQTRFLSLFFEHYNLFVIRCLSLGIVNTNFLNLPFSHITIN